MKKETDSAEDSAIELFPGIYAQYRDIRAAHMCIPGYADSSRVLQLEYCHAGSAVGKYGVLSAGGMAVYCVPHMDTDVALPTGSYRGIAFWIDTDKAPASLSVCLEGVEVRPERLLEKLCPAGNDVHVLRGDELCAPGFSAAYALQPEFRPGYLRVKILETLLLLDALPPKVCDVPQHFTQAQARLVQDVCGYLAENMGERITINMLSEKFHISPTQLKLSFRSVYGQSVYGYIRAQKMQFAAEMLRSTDKKILEIAGLCGYSNGGKFAAAFCNEMGATPGEYRRRCGS